jgi:hypothetical protein
MSLWSQIIAESINFGVAEFLALSCVKFSFRLTAPAEGEGVR